MAWIDERPEIAEALKEPTDEFLKKMQAVLIAEGSLTEKQEIAVLAIINRQPCPGGRIEITGQIVSAQWKQHPKWGPKFNILVQDDLGFRVYGTAPKEIREISADIEIRGRRCTFEAVVTPHEEFFGWFKYAKYGEILEDN